MDKRTVSIIVAGVCGLGAALSMCWLGYNLFHVVPAVQAMASTGAPGPSWFDGIVTTISGLFAGGLTVSSVVAGVLAFISKSAAATVDKLAPNASVDTKAQAVDTAQIVAIRGALAIVKDPTTRTSLIAAGRAAFDDLRDRTFATPVPEVAQ